MIHTLETSYRSLRRVFSRTSWVVRLFGLKPADEQPGTQRGLVLVQIDGLGKNELDKALQSSEMPFLAHLLADEHYSLASFYSGLPSSTPSVQAELFYGVKTAVPAFAFLDRTSGKLKRMYEPDSALGIEHILQQQGAPLLRGGSAYCNIYTGGASDAHFCASSMGWATLLDNVRPMAWCAAGFLYAPLLVRLVVRSIMEVFLAIMDMFRGLISGRNFRAEVKFVPTRVAISILLRDLITIGAKMDIARGVPIIHLNYLGYDEQAHRRGPESGFAHWALKGIDRSIQQLWYSCHQSQHLHYDLWVYSDHGQESTMPYVKLTGHSIEQALYRVLLSYGLDASTDLQSLSEGITTHRSHLLGGHYLQKLFPGISVESDSVRGMNSRNGVTVVAMGPVGHVYLPTKLRNTQILNRLSIRLVDDEQVPGVAYLDSQGKAKVRVPGCTFDLLGECTEVFGAAHPFVTQVARDLDTLVRHANAGQLILLGWVAGSHAVSFPVENGAHAGAGPQETHAFLLMPTDVMPSVSGKTALRPLDLRQSAMSFLELEPVRLVPETRTVRTNTTRQLRVMTYNVHSCIGTDSRIAPERIARVIARFKPDVVALQELDVGRRRTLHVHQAECIGQLLEMNHDFFPAIQVDEEEYGDAILTHLPIRRSRKGSLGVPLARQGREPRGVQWLTLDCEGIDVQIFNTHLGLYSAERLQQVEQLLSDQWLSHPDCRGPVVICGDFNATPRSPTMRSLQLSCENVQILMDNSPLSTFPSRFPVICIDHILVRDVAQVSNVIVPQSSLTRLASDHLPLVVDINLNGAD